MRTPHYSGHFNLTQWCPDYREIQLIYILQLQVSRVHPTVYALAMNNSILELEAHKMSDGSLLLSLHGASHTTYLKEEAEGYRVVIGGRTCVFEKENDPRVLR